MADENDNETDPREGAGADVSSRRRLMSSANAGVLIVATIGIAFLANAIVSQFSRFRIDMTENNIYTLSKPSKDVVGKFERDVQVKAYISANMPPPMHTLRRRVRDMLTEYEAASGGALSFEIVSPNADELTDKQQKEIEQEAKGYGCEEVGLRSGGEERVSLQTVYKCVAFITDGGKKQEVIKNLSGGGQQQGQMNFEYEFTKSLMNLQGREARKVAFVKGFGGLADQRGFTRKIGQRFDQLFDGLIQATSVDLSKQNPTIPEDVSALILLDPSKKVGKKAKFKIDQFLQGGGSVGWFQSPTGKQQQRRRRRRMPGGGMRKPLEPKLRSFFSEYGLKLRKDTVFDPDNGTVTIAQVQGKRGLVRHPATFTTTDINRTLPFTKNFGTLGFPAPSSIQVQAAAEDNDELSALKIVETEDTALRRPELMTDLSLGNLEKASGDEQGPFTLAAALKGNIPSYFADKKPPKGMSKKKTKKATSSRLMVVGSGSLLQPQNGIGYKRRLAALGQRFFFASLEWLAQDTALARIRGKSLPRLIDDVDPTKKRWIQFINIAGVPAVFALIGVLMMFRRRRRRDILRY